MTSVVVPTYNGSSKVERLLISLVKQLNETRELIIVDDGSTDGSAKSIARLLQHVQNVRLIEKSNGGRSVARNSGAKEAKGEFIVFIDDDILVPPNFLERVEYVQRKFPTSWVTGTVVQDIADLPYQDFFKFRSKLDYVPKNLQHSSTELVEQPFFTTQQLSVQSSIFHEVGGFDEQLTDSEDFELSVRVKFKGYSILHDVKNVVRHADYSDFDKFIYRQKEYKDSKEALAIERPEILERYPDILRSKNKNGFFKSWARRFFVYNRLWKAFFRSDLRMVVPETVRFKMYDLVISSTIFAHSSFKEKL